MKENCAKLIVQKKKSTMLGFLAREFFTNM